MSESHKEHNVEGPGGAVDPAAAGRGLGRAQLLRSLGARRPGEMSSAASSVSTIASAGRGALLRSLERPGDSTGSSSTTSLQPPVPAGRGALLRGLAGAAGPPSSTPSSREEMLAKLQKKREESAGAAGAPQPIGRAGLVSLFHFFSLRTIKSM